MGLEVMIIFETVLSIIHNSYKMGVMSKHGKTYARYSFTLLTLNVS